MDLVAQADALVRVAREGGFTAAAEVCHAPQPVLSRRVAALEKEVGGSLLHRGPRGVELTEFGTTVLPLAQDLVATAHRLRHVGDAEAADCPHTVHVAFPPLADPRVLARVKKDLAGRGLTVVFDDAPVSERADLLAAGSVQVAFLPQEPTTADLRIPLGLAGSDAPLLTGALPVTDPLPAGQEPLPEDTRRVLVGPEDDTPAVRQALAHAVDPARIVTGLSRTEAVASVYDRGDLLLAGVHEAQGLGLTFRPLDTPVVRGLRIAVAPDHPCTTLLHRELPRVHGLFATALHATGT
ncbi:LysR family transcriptional regulator [Brevibacterium litoralis]|uniref:LysR family transcriptional regulator n=1 Tax=Brevibacterium litoralis TaxID=3138935 RepID=UPI0032ECA317